MNVLALWVCTSLLLLLLLRLAQHVSVCSVALLHSAVETEVWLPEM
jgi:hypothetical protein